MTLARIGFKHSGTRLDGDSEDLTVDRCRDILAFEWMGPKREADVAQFLLNQVDCFLERDEHRNRQLRVVSAKRRSAEKRA